VKVLSAYPSDLDVCEKIEQISRWRESIINDPQIGRLFLSALLEGSDRSISSEEFNDGVNKIVQAKDRELKSMCPHLINRIRENNER
jgi:GTP cyclohydrolase I